jgi:hypothetical protein
MTSIYKFLHREDLSIILEQGRLRFGKLSHYRELFELHGRQKWIGDPHEGRTEIFHDPILAEVVTHEQSEVAARVGIRISPGSRGMVMIGNTKSVSFRPDVHIFCASRGDLDALRPVMCHARATDQRPYDACLLVKNPSLLAEQILLKGTLRALSGAPVAEHFDVIPFRAVTYDVVKTNAASGPIRAPSPYLKDAYFESQAETRLVLEPKGRIDLPDVLVVEISNPRDLFSEVPLK